MQTTQLNKITLCGIVGSSRIFEANGTKLTKFTLATTRAYTSMDKTPVLETTWFDCLMSGKSPQTPVKGSKVKIEGRVRCSSVMGPDGLTRTAYEVVVRHIDFFPEDSTLLFQDDRKPAPKGNWDFRYEEEHFDTAGENFVGALTNGNRFLFWHAFAEGENKPVICHIYDSLLMTPENEICSYLWTAENDGRVTAALNGLEDESDWCGEHCPLRTLEFSDEED